MGAATTTVGIWKLNVAVIAAATERIFLFVYLSIWLCWVFTGASQVALVVNSLPADAGFSGSIPESERSSLGGHGNPLQYSWLENPMDRGAWWVTVHGVTKSWTQLSD